MVETLLKSASITFTRDKTSCCSIPTQAPNSISAVSAAVKKYSALGYIPPAPEARLAWPHQENKTKWPPAKCAAALT